jgi:hypothetical protein
METELASKMMIVSVNFSCALFSHWHFLTFEEGLVGYPEMLVRNYHSVLHNISEEHGSHMMIWR